MEAEIHELTPATRWTPSTLPSGRSSRRHLAECAQCQEDLASFWEVTGALAVAADGPAPRPALRDRILEAARAEQQTVVPLELAAAACRRCSPRSTAIAASSRSGSASTRFP